MEPAANCAEGMRQRMKEKRMKLYAMTDVGRKREVNQDYVYVTDSPIGPFPNLLAVADGMGGHKAGDFASKYTVNVLIDELKNTPLDKPEEILRNVVGIANHKLIEAASTDIKLEGMGTTLVVATVVGNTLYFANVGDSRVYLYRDGQLLQLTEDHTYVNTLLKAGVISREQAAMDDRKNVITKALGAEVTVEPDFFQVNFIKDDVFIICTDGLYDEVDEDEMKKIIEENPSMSDVCAAMISAANENGGHDNITVISLKVTEEDVDEQ